MRHYGKIDGLRFIAISLVLLEHFAIFIGRPIFAGFYGVDLFFVISGFLVTTVLLKHNDKSFKEGYIHFIGRRTLRIFPIYYLTILILLICGLSAVRENIGYLLTFTFNYAIVFKNLPSSPVSPFWSLCVEEQFYLGWPIAVLLLKKNRLWLLFLISLIIVIGYTQQTIGVFPGQDQYNYYSLLTRMASLGIGALGAMLATMDKLPKRILQSTIIEYAVLILLPATLLSNFLLKMPVLGLFSLYLVLKASFYGFNAKCINHFLENKTVRDIGNVSYGIYLYHLPIGYYFSLYVFDPAWSSIHWSGLAAFKKLEWHAWIFKFPLYFLISIVVARFSFRYIETPFLQMKDRFFPPR